MGRLRPQTPQTLSILCLRFGVYTLPSTLQTEDLSILCLRFKDYWQTGEAPAASFQFSVWDSGVVANPYAGIRLRLSILCLRFRNEMGRLRPQTPQTLSILCLRFGVYTLPSTLQTEDLSILCLRFKDYWQTGEAPAASFQFSVWDSGVVANPYAGIRLRLSILCLRFLVYRKLPVLLVCDFQFSVWDSPSRLVEDLVVLRLSILCLRFS
jgi:hypothetical protein